MEQVELETAETVAPEQQPQVSEVDGLILTGAHEAEAMQYQVAEVTTEVPATDFIIGYEEDSASVVAEDEIVLNTDDWSAVASIEHSTEVEVAQVAEQPETEIDLVATDKGIVPGDDDSGISADILAGLKSGCTSDRVKALGELAQVGGEDAIRLIGQSFDDQSIEVRNAAAHALSEVQSDRAQSFTTALREGTPERRRKIGAAIASSGLATQAIDSLTNGSRERTYGAFSLLFLMAKAGETQPLMDAIEAHTDLEVRLAVVRLLALSGQTEIVTPFRRLAVRGSLPAEVRSAVMEAIHQISKSDRNRSVA